VRAHALLGVCALQHHGLKIAQEVAENRYRGVPEMRHPVQLLAIALSTLALTAPLASAQTLGEVTAATGIHGTLAKQGVSSSGSALDTVKRSLAKSTKPRDYDFDSSSGAKAGSRPAGKNKKLALRSEMTAHSRGSWVNGATAGKGSASTAWGKGGAGWDSPGSGGWAAGGNGWAQGGGGGGSTGRRRRS